MKMARYRISGTREYRGHKPGDVVVMRLLSTAELRAVKRGDIEIIERIDLEVPPEYELPRGWLRPKSHQSTEAPRGAFFMPGGS